MIRKRMDDTSARMQFDAPKAAPPDSSVAQADYERPLNLKEWGLLDIMRCLFVGYAEADSHAWDAAVLRGDWHFEGGVGHPLTQALVDFIEALRLSRRTAFHFSDPRCPCCRGRVTDCERRMIAVVRAKAADRVSSARTHAMLVCEGGADDAFLAAADRVSQALRRAKARTSRANPN